MQPIPRSVMSSWLLGGGDDTGLRQRKGGDGDAQEKLVEVTVDRDIATVPDNRCFQKIERKDERTLSVRFDKSEVNAGEVLSAIQRDGYGIVDVVTREPDLEDVFLNLTRAATQAA